jgi:hemoglobin
MDDFSIRPMNHGNFKEPAPRSKLHHTRSATSRTIEKSSIGRAKTMQEVEVYSVIGEEGFTRLVAAFYRLVPQDDLLGPMYPAQDLSGAEQRLRDFLIGRFGGPQTYIEQRGHPRLRARHSPFAINQTIRDRWMRLMENALAEASLPSKAEEVLRNSSMRCLPL